MGTPDENLLKAMAAFGGGIASTGRACGALLGGVAFLSSLYGRGNPSEQDHPSMWRLSHKLAKKFEEITKPFGGLNCVNIAGVNWSDPQQTKNFYTNPQSTYRNCVRLVGDTAFFLGEILDQVKAEKAK